MQARPITLHLNLRLDDRERRIVARAAQEAATNTIGRLLYMRRLLPRTARRPAGRVGRRRRPEGARPC